MVGETKQSIIASLWVAASYPFQRSRSPSESRGGEAWSQVTRVRDHLGVERPADLVSDRGGKAIPVEGPSGIPELPCPDVVASHPDQAGSRKGV